MDSAGNTASCGFTVSVMDAELPVLVCPTDIVVSTSGGTCSSVATWSDPIVTDNCGNFFATQDSGLLSGSVFPLGQSTVSYTATDVNGNGPVTCSFHITVDDLEKPTFSACPSDFLVSATICSGSLVYRETFDDSVTGWTHGAISGATYTWSVRSRSGGTTPLQFTSNVYGTPNAGQNPGYEHSYLKSKPFSTVGGAVVMFDSLVATDGTPEDLHYVDISYDGGNTWTTVVSPSHSLFTKQTETFHTHSILVSVASGAPQTIVRFRYETVAAGVVDNSITGWFIDNFVVTNACTGTASYVVQAADNCPGITMTQNFGIPSGEAFPLGPTYNEFVISDPSGNTAVCSFTVTVEATITLNPAPNTRMMMYVAHEISWHFFGTATTVDMYLLHASTSARTDIVLNWPAYPPKYTYRPQRIVPGNYYLVTQSGNSPGVKVPVTIIAPY